MKRFGRILGHLVFGLVVLTGAAWTGLALFVQLGGVTRLAAFALLALAVLGAGLARLRQRRRGWAVVAISALGVAGWYATITPREDRDWAIDVSRGVKAQVAGDIVTLSDIRDFDWTSETEATRRWISHSYDLRELRSLDMITSVWDNPDIAHLLVSFGFAEDEHVVFSVEIRREAGEKFNELGGFFRQFELVLIGATERDIVRLRTNYRHEDVRLFPIELSPEQLREMFMAYVGLARQLEEKPRFYNTLTANCTTVVYQLAHVLKADLPLDWRLVLSGHLPDYMAALGVLGGDGPVAMRAEAARITAQAQAADPDMDYSRAIRLKAAQ